MQSIILIKHGYMTSWPLVKISEMLENRLYFGIPQPEINLDLYFQFSNSTITLLDIEFDPIFTVFDQRWQSDVMPGG